MTSNPLTLAGDRRFFRPWRLDTVKVAALPFVHKWVTVQSWHENVTMRDRYPDDSTIGHVTDFSMDIPESELLTTKPEGCDLDYEQIEVMLACNNGHIGDFIGHFCMLDIRDSLQLEGDIIEDENNPSISFDSRMRTMTVDGVRYPVLAHQSHVGNLCWDLVRMYGKDVIDLLNRLRTKGGLVCTVGELRLMNMWDQEKSPYQLQDIRILMKGEQ